MATIKRIGFNDNFTGGSPRPGGYAGYGGYQDYRAAPKPQQPRAWGPGGAGWQDRQGMVVPAAPKVAPAPTPVASTPVKPVAAPAPRVGLDDPEILSDPMLMKVKKLQETRRGDVRAGALARKKELAIQTGDSGLAREFGLDDTVAATAARNPLSAFAALKEAARVEERDLEEGLNQANLHFGGYRFTQIKELADSITAREAQAQAQAMQAFNAIQNDLLSGLSEADRLEMDAEVAAYERAVARRAAGGGGAGGVVDPGVGGPPAATPAAPPAGPLGAVLDTANPPPIVDDRDPYYGGGLSDIAAELLPFPGRKRQPDPLLAELLGGRGGRMFAV